MPVSKTELDTFINAPLALETVSPVIQDNVLYNGDTVFGTTPSIAGVDIENGAVLDNTTFNAPARQALGELTRVMAGINNVRVADAGVITALVNSVIGNVNSNTTLIQAAFAELVAKLRALDDVFDTDSDALARVNAMNAAIASMNGDLVAGITAIIAEVDALTRIDRKEVSVTAANGRYAFGIAAENFGASFAAPEDYVVTAMVIGNPNARVDVVGKTKDGFELRVMSQNVHIKSQPVDCSGEGKAVVVAVDISHAKR